MADGLTQAVLMDRIYRRQRHIYDLTRRFYLLGRDRLIARLDPPAGGTVLEIGCGTGRNLIAAARAYPDARFFGADISFQMLATARDAIAREGLADRIKVAHADAAALEPVFAFGRAGFDRVFLSYAISMIPPWQGALAKAGRALAPGGRLLVVDFGQMERLPRLLRHLHFAWLRRFHVSPRGDLDLALESLARLTSADLRFDRLWGGFSWYGELRLPASGDRLGKSAGTPVAATGIDR